MDRVKQTIWTGSSPGSRPWWHSAFSFCLFTRLFFFYSKYSVCITVWQCNFQTHHLQLQIESGGMSLEPLESQSFKAWNADQSYIRLVLPTYRLRSELCILWYYDRMFFVLVDLGLFIWFRLRTILPCFTSWSPYWTFACLELCTCDFTINLLQLSIQLAWRSKSQISVKQHSYGCCFEVWRVELPCDLRHNNAAFDVLKPSEMIHG